MPFQSWAPDVYQGSPTPVTAFMASGVKVAAFGAMLRLFYVGFGGASWDWRPAFWIIAILTFFVGSMVALAQSDIKRMLAYSSIAHAGFLLLGVIAVTPEGLAATMFYLVTYGLATVGAFGIVMLIRDDSGETSSMDAWRGLGRTNPLLAAAFPAGGGALVAHAPSVGRRPVVRGDAPGRTMKSWPNGPTPTYPIFLTAPMW